MIADEVDFTVREIGTAFVVAETLPFIPDASSSFLVDECESLTDVFFPVVHNTDKELEHIRVRMGASVPIDIGYSELPQRSLESVLSLLKGATSGKK